MKTPEIVLKNGLIIDGSGQRPRYQGDVAIGEGVILAIEEPGSIKGVDEVDCSGFIIAPGFIDTHSHSDLRILVEPQLPMKIRQGVTLEIFGQDGVSVAPIKSVDQPQVARSLAGLDGQLGRAWDWETVAEYFDAIDRAKPAIDCAYLVPHGAVRLSAMGMEDRLASKPEIGVMQDLIRQSLREGALGLSTGLIYPPCCFADTAELIELCRPVAEAGGVFVSHMRSESDYIEDAVAEMIEIGKQSGVHVHISHFKIAGRENWWRIDDVLEMIHRAQAEGVRITADQYPYIAGSTMLGAILPPAAHAGGVGETLDRLSNPDERDRIRAVMLDRAPSRWDNFWKWSGPQGIIISDIPSGNQPDLLGRDLATAAAVKMGKDYIAEEEAADFAMDLLLSERMGVGMISFSQSEEIVRKILAEPYVNICTDGLLGGRPHPRAYGTYPRILGRYVRDHRLFSLEEAVHRMSGLAADTFRLGQYGRLEAGARANLTVFDPETVLDRATFEDSRQYPDGIQSVLVRGAFTIRDALQSPIGSGGSVRRVTS